MTKPEAPVQHDPYSQSTNEKRRICREIINEAKKITELVGTDHPIYFSKGMI